MKAQLRPLDLVREVALPPNGSYLLNTRNHVHAESLVTHLF